ncbi:hypothetical protein [Klebsiella aerogenes]|uniref:hypothetical protein n=1 Tax=Klebsiella aerogenes TaxID=548 RepID=UPI0036D0F2EE
MTITLQAVNELIQSLESAGELSIKERKYLDLAKAYADKEAESVAQALTFEKCRELSGCPAGVDLQDWVKQLAAENVGLKESVEHAAGCIAAAEAEGLIDALSETTDERLAGLVHRRLCHAYLEVKTPATDRIVAGIKADGVEMAAKSDQFSTWVQQGLRSFAIGIRQGDDLSEQLREGVDK